EIDLDVMLAGAERHRTEQAVGTQHGHIAAVDACSPARVPGLALQQVARLRQRDVRMPALGGCDVRLHGEWRGPGGSGGVDAFEYNLAIGIEVRLPHPRQSRGL